MNKTGIVILAAGDSSRFGAIKQLASFHEKTLLQHIIDEAATAGVNSIIVVLGAKAMEVVASIDDSKVSIVFNTDWQQGLSSGIVAGVQAIKELDNRIEKIILTVCDQPYVTAAVFQQLTQVQQQTGKPIVACAYANTLGTPALFSGKYIDILLYLTGDAGAKQIIKHHPEDVATLDFPGGAIDIDTQKDYAELVNKH